MITEKHFPNWRRIVIWASVALFYFYENILTTCLGVMTDDIMVHFSISHMQVGMLASAFFTAYGLMQIPVGWLIQRYSVRKCTTFAALLCVVGSWILATSPSFYIAVLGRVLMGIGASFAPLCAFEVSAIYFHSRRFAMLTGLLLTFGSLGGIVGQTPFRIIFEKYGFQNSISMVGSLGIFIALLSYLSIPSSQKDQLHAISFKKLSSTLKEPNTWYMMLYAAFMYGPYLVLQSVWGKPFIEEALGLNAHASAGLLQIMMLGFLIGGPILGYISDRYDQRRSFLITSSVCTGLLITALLQPIFMSAAGYIILLFLIGLSCSGFLVSFTVLKQSVAPEVRSISLGIMNSINTLGGIALPPIIGAWIRQNIEAGVDHPYRHSLIILPIVIGLAVLFSLAIKEHKESK